MKLSNKILIGFFALVFIYLTAVFAEIRLRGTSVAMDDSNSIAETVDISGVAYLVLHDLDNTINVVGSDQPRVEVRSSSGDLLRTLKYTISGDTLKLSQGPPDDSKRVKISVFVPKSSLKGMTVDAATAVVEGLQLKHLDVSQHRGRVWIYGSSLGNIRLELSGLSYLQIYDTGMDTLSATIEQSEVYIASPVRLLKGSLKNAAFLRVMGVDEIQFKKDESSRLHLYE